MNRSRVLRQGWYVYHVVPGVDADRPGIYEWNIVSAAMPMCRSSSSSAAGLERI